MPISTTMAETAQDEPGAPIDKDAIDPELIKLQRPRPKVGIVTAAGLVFLSGLFLLRMTPDRRFSGASSEPQRVAVADVLAGNVASDRFVSIDGTAEPLMSHAIRATTAKGSQGLRVVPVRGTDERLWLVISGDGWEDPQLKGYAGRLRKLADLPLATVANDYFANHPQPVFATAEAVRAGFASGQVSTVSGETVAVHDGDRVAYERVERDAAVIVGTFNEKLPNAAAWSSALIDAGVQTHGQFRATNDVARFDVAMPDAVNALTDKLAKANLWAARVEPVTHHDEATWGALKAGPPSDIDLVGIYTARAIPKDAYALITSERPDDYWYALPVTILVALIGLLFAWALIREVKKLLPARA
jgi:hypothetical protein